MPQSQGTSQNRQKQPDQSGTGQDSKNYQKLPLRAFVIFSYFVNIVIVLALLFIFLTNAFASLLLFTSQHPLLTILISIGILLFAGLYVLVTRLTKENKRTQDRFVPQHPLLAHLISVTVALTAGFYARATRLDFAALITDAIHLDFAALKANVARASIVVIPDQMLEIVENLKKGDEIEAEEVQAKSVAYVRMASESSRVLKRAANSLDAQLIAAYQQLEPLSALTSRLLGVDAELKRLEIEREHYLVSIANRMSNEPELEQQLKRVHSALDTQDTKELIRLLSDLEERLTRLEKHMKPNQAKEGISTWLSAANNVASIIIAIPSIITIIISVFTLLHR